MRYSELKLLFFATLYMSYVLIQQSNAYLCPVELKKQVKDYWVTRAKKDFKRLYLMEAPYIQFLAPFKIYKIYLSNTIKPIEIKIQHAQCKKYKQGTYCDLYLKLKEKDSNKIIFIHDYWVLVGDKWYHIIKDPLVFSNCFPP